MIRAAAVFIFALGMVSPVVATAAGGGFRATTDVSLAETDRVIADGTAGRLIAVGGGSVNVGNIFLRVTLYDGRSFTRLRSVEFPPYLPQVARVGTSPLVFAFDESQRLLHVLVYRSRSDQDNGANPQLLSIDVDRLTIAAGPKPLTLFPRGVRYYGARSWPGGAIGFVGQVVPQVTVPQAGEVGAPEMFGVLVGEVDGKTARPTWGPVPVRGCQTAISDQDQAAIARRGGSVYVGCGTGALATFTAPGTPATVAIDRDDTTHQRLNVLPGSYAGGDSYLDPGADRLLLVGRAGDRPSQAVWVFDLAHEVFLGEIAAGDFVIRGFGIDATTGRIYISIGRVAERGAVLVSSDRGIDIPQAQTFPIPAATGPIFVIPSTHSLIVPVETNNQRTVYRVYQDRVSASVFSVSGLFDYTSYDSLSADSPQFEGDVQGFGVRLHNVGGVTGIAKNTFYLDGADYWPFEPTGLKDGDRDLYLARVNAAHLSQDEASAAATAVDRDDTTAADYATLARRSHGALSEEWPFASRDCRDFGPGAAPASGDGARARCEQRAGHAEADASYTGADAGGLVSVGSASSAARIRLDPTLGLVAEIVSEVRHVAISDEVRIARIASTATVSARGAAGSATVRYSRVFEGVKAGDFSCSTQCDPIAVARAIADALGMQFRVELPPADTVATKRGAHAHLLRDPWGHQQDVVLASQDPTERQVPALRLIYTGDNAVASRLIVEFAGAMADATYLRPGAGGPPEGALEPVPPVVVPSVLPTTTTRVDTLPPTQGSTIRRIVRGVQRGWRLAFSMGPRSIALWSLLLFPAFLLARRRQLASLIRGTR